MLEEPTEYLAGRLQDALAHDPRVAALDVHVRVAGGAVYLTGTVPTPERQAAVEVVAREVAPDHEVHNQVTLYRMVEEDQPEHLS